MKFFKKIKFLKISHNYLVLFKLVKRTFLILICLK